MKHVSLCVQSVCRWSYVQKCSFLRGLSLAVPHAVLCAFHISILPENPGAWVQAAAAACICLLLSLLVVRVP
jgi:hypothetical protein